MQNKFNFFTELNIPDEIFKSARKDDNKKYDNMVVFGRATTNIEDRQGETLEPAGFIFDNFLKNGHLNLEHWYTRKGDASAIIGEPMDAYVKDNEFFVKGKLYKGHPKAEALWDTLLIMKANKSTRKLGFSIEGNAIERDSRNKKRILKANINHLALTFNPVGFNTYADISKGRQEEDYVDYKFETDKTTHGGKEVMIEVEENGKRITIDKDFKITIKAMDMEATKPLRKESLNKRTFDLKNLDVIVKNYKSGNISENVMDEFRGILKKDLVVQ